MTKANKIEQKKTWTWYKYRERDLKRHILLTSYMSVHLKQRVFWFGRDFTLCGYTISHTFERILFSFQQIWFDLDLFHFSLFKSEWYRFVFYYTRNRNSNKTRTNTYSNNTITTNGNLLFPFNQFTWLMVHTTRQRLLLLRQRWR